MALLDLVSGRANDDAVFRPWGCPLALRLAAVFSALLFGMVAVSGPGPDPGPVDYIGTAIFGLIVAWGFWWAGRIRIEVDASGVTVVGYFRTAEIAWADIACFTADYYFTVMRTDGSVIRSAVLGKARWRLDTNRRGPSDDVAEQLNARLEGNLPP